MECFEAGKITLEDTGGLDLHFGSAEDMVRLTEMIARREGFGDVLAEGSARAAERIGQGTGEFLITTKKQETPAHMPQLKPSLGVIYAVNPFGSDHQSSEHDSSYRHYPERMSQLDLTDPQPRGALNAEVVRYAQVTQHLYSYLDTINVCQFVYGPAWQLYDSQQLVDVVRAVTGWDVSVEEILEVGERRLNMLRAFNAREGIGREKDTLPKKFFERPLEGGRSDGYRVDPEEWGEALETYYQLAGWDSETGHPTPGKLESLGLDWITI
jgi:aldehyde:ferredoxin oxidoreductase